MTMRKFMLAFVFILMTGMIFAGSGKCAAESDPSRIILYTYYRQMGWGDRVQIGSLDEEGVVRTLTGFDSDLKWTYKPEEQLEYLSQTEKFTAEGTLSYSDLFALKSLIYSVEDQGSRSVPAANDAGTEKSYAVRYNTDGTAECILLGMSGDDYFENFDPNAQSLYLQLRLLFPNVTCYAYQTGMGPQGFAPVPFSEFTRMDADAVKTADIKAYLSDCEEGAIPLEITEQEKAELRSLVCNGMVTGKADCVVSTGGFNSYSFFDPEGNLLGIISIEDDLLVFGDGHYYYRIP